MYEREIESIRNRMDAHVALNQAIPTHFPSDLYAHIASFSEASPARVQHLWDVQRKTYHVSTNHQCIAELAKLVSPDASTSWENPQPTAAGLDAKKSKSKPSMLPWRAMKALAAVFDYGFKKHGKKHGFREWPVPEYEEALLRHVIEYFSGNPIDEESGCEHLAMIAGNALMILDIRATNQEK